MPSRPEYTHDGIRSFLCCCLHLQLEEGLEKITASFIKPLFVCSFVCLLRYWLEQKDKHLQLGGRGMQNRCIQMLRLTEMDVALMRWTLFKSTDSWEGTR